ncbi:MAG: hypothetical protein IJR49_05385, partial [Treponema sp.]|nr:hypothetical protein [Treponema sp.]
MKKVSIIILENEKFNALTKLRKLGLVHLETLNGTGDKLNKLKETQSTAIQVLSVLSELKAPK